MKNLIPLTRTLVFYFSLALFTLCWTTIMTPLIRLFPFHKRHSILVKNWAIIAVNLCRFICGVKWQVTGQKNIPEQPCVVISNHQSTWETFFLQTLLTPQTQVLKQELLKIPFFGWALAAAKPIAIDRSDVRKSLQQVREQGKASLMNNVWVLIFPEGTRTKAGKIGKFSRGGAGLAHAAQCNILPIAHNAGVYWPMDTWIKKPGTIRVTIGPVIDVAELTVAEANDQARNWIENQLNRMG